MKRTRAFIQLTLLLFATFATQTVIAVNVQQQIIKRADWPRYANGASLSALPQTQAIISRFDENDKIQIIIRYPGGDDGIEWGKEMLRWFVAYGVPGRYLRLELGSGAPDQLLLELVDKS